MRAGYGRSKTLFWPSGSSAAGPGTVRKDFLSLMADHSAAGEFTPANLQLMPTMATLFSAMLHACAEEGIHAAFSFYLGFWSVSGHDDHVPGEFR